MNVLLVAATPLEIKGLQQFLSSNASQIGSSHFTIGNLHLQILITGVGMVHTAVQLSKEVSRTPFSLAINAGIAGSYRRDLTIGNVVSVEWDRFGDTGAEMADGTFQDCFELGLDSPDDVPFQDGWLKQTLPQSVHLPGIHHSVKGITVGTVAGTNPTITQRVLKYQPVVESMEGAAFYYTCHSFQQPAIQIRAISNYVEVRNRDNWDIPLAVHNLNEWLIDFIAHFG